MKIFIATLFYFCSVSCMSQQSNSQETVFRAVNVITMENDRVLQNQDVLVRDGKIVSVTKNNKRAYGPNTTVIDARGKYLMPGLAEMHGHVPPVDDLEPMKKVLMLFVVHGITTVRGMLGHPRHLELREKIRNGEITGPHFWTSGPSFNGQSVTSAEQGIAKVKEQKQAGYDFLKIHPGLTLENYNAMARTARDVGIPFAGHVPFDVGVWKAIEAKQQTIDHLDAFIEGLVPGVENMTQEQTGFFGMHVADKIDNNHIPELIKALKDNNVWVVPTQALAERWMSPVRTAESFRNDPEMKYMDETTLNNWVRSKKNLVSGDKYDSAKMINYLIVRRKLINECNKAGVGLLLGCDAPQVFNVPGISTHHELKYLVDAGLTPYEAIKTGTVNVGKFYNKSSEMGIIRAGANSDLLLLNGNPLEDISNTKKIGGVMLGERWFSRAALDEELKKLEKSIGQ